MQVLQPDKHTFSVPFDKIQLGERHRKEYLRIIELAESIKTRGLLQPLIIDDNFLLIAGGRRYHAIKLLGWERVTVQLRKDVDELTYRELELEENIQREDLTWSEKAKLVAEIDRLKREKYGSAVPGSHDTTDLWTQTDTAIAMDMSQPVVSRDILVAKALEVYPELANEPDRTTALKKFKQFDLMVKREIALRQLAKQKQEGLNVLHLGTALEVLQSLPDASVDLILTDPPYGSDMDTINMGKSGYDVHFEDDPDVLKMVSETFREARRVLKPEGHLYCFSGIKDNLLWRMMELLSNAGYYVDTIPIVWVKSTWGLVDYAQRFAPAWEPVIFANGGRELSAFSRNTFIVDSVPDSERYNIAQKPIELLKRLIELSTIEGEVVLDPFAGSASTLVAAKELNRRYIGIEKDRAQWTAGTLRLNPPEEDSDEMVDGMELDQSDERGV